MCFVIENSNCCSELQGKVLRIVLQNIDVPGVFLIRCIAISEAIYKTNVSLEALSSFKSSESLKSSCQASQPPFLKLTEDGKWEKA